MVEATEPTKEEVEKALVSVLALPSIFLSTWVYQLGWNWFVAPFLGLIDYWHMMGLSLLVVGLCRGAVKTKPTWDTLAHVYGKPLVLVVLFWLIAHGL